MTRTLAIIGAVHIATIIFGIALGLSGRLDGAACVSGPAEIARAYRQGWMRGGD